MRRSVPLLLGLALAAAGAVAFDPGGAAGGPAPGPEELEALGALVVGEWQAPGSHHVFEWGVGRRLLRSRSYVPSDSARRLVSEGQWFWDGQAGVIRGVVLADGMPFNRMEYRTRVDGDRVVHHLRTFGPAVREYVETWTFTADAYRWELEEVTEAGREPLMSGIYERVDPGDAL